MRNTLGPNLGVKLYRACVTVLNQSTNNSGMVLEQLTHGLPGLYSQFILYVISHENDRYKGKDPRSEFFAYFLKCHWKMPTSGCLWPWSREFLFFLFFPKQTFRVGERREFPSIYRKNYNQLRNIGILMLWTSIVSHYFEIYSKRDKELDSWFRSLHGKSKTEENCSSTGPSTPFLDPPKDFRRDPRPPYSFANDEGGSVDSAATVASSWEWRTTRRCPPKVTNDPVGSVEYIWSGQSELKSFEL